MAFCHLCQLDCIFLTTLLCEKSKIVSWYLGTVINGISSHRLDGAPLKKICVDGYATADGPVPMLARIFRSRALQQTRGWGKKKQQPAHRRCEIKTGTRHALVETVACIDAKSPYCAGINIRESTAGTRIYLLCAIIFLFTVQLAVRARVPFKEG